MAGEVLNIWVCNPLKLYYSLIGKYHVIYHYSYNLPLGNIIRQTMKYSISINHELKIIRYKHSGLIDAGDIGKAWKEFLTIKEFTILKYNLLSDYRNGKFQIAIRYLPEIIDFMRAIENVVRGKKQALIVDEPYSVAASMLFEAEVNLQVGFKVEVFTTETAALKWLTN